MQARCHHGKNRQSTTVQEQNELRAPALKHACGMAGGSDCKLAQATHDAAAIEREGGRRAVTCTHFRVSYVVPDAVMSIQPENVSAAVTDTFCTHNTRQLCGQHAADLRGSGGRCATIMEPRR